jgi:DNA repair exonuclease SbcCD ATPase subunit
MSSAPKLVVWHISDLHIKQTGELNVYACIQYAFDQLVQEIKKTEAEVQILVIAGDVFDSKTKVREPDLLCFVNVLKKIPKNIEILIIPGNHDFVDNFDGKFTTSIGRAIPHPDLPNARLFARSQTVGDVVDGFNFFMLSPMDRETPPASDSNNLNIAVAHWGGFSDKRLNYEYLRNFDAVLLGDAHRHRSAVGQKNIIYSGSLIQIAKDEDGWHGCLKWTFGENREEIEFVPLKLYQFLATIRVRDNDMTTITKNFDPTLVENFVGIHMRPQNCSKEFLMKLRAICKKEYGCDRVGCDTNQHWVAPNKMISNASLKEIHLEEFERLIEGSPDANELRELHMSLFDEYYTSELATPRKWKLLYMAWSNLYSYGMGNYINFENMEGIHTLEGRNASGKSSLIAILKFALLDKRIGEIKMKDRIFGNKGRGEVILCFACNGQKYVTRRGISSTDNNADRQLYRIDADGICHYIAEGAPVQAAIYDIIGKNDMLDVVNIAEQNRETFTGQGKTNRTKNLLRHLGLNIFEEICKVVEEKRKATCSAIDVLKLNIDKKNTHQEIQDVLRALAVCEKNILGLEKKRVAINSQIEVISSSISNLNSNSLMNEEKNLRERLCKIKLPENFSLDACADEIQQLNDEIKNFISELCRSDKFNEKTIGEFRSFVGNYGNEFLGNTVHEIGNMIKIAQNKKLSVFAKELIDRMKFSPSCQCCATNNKIINSFVAQTRNNLVTDHRIGLLKTVKKIKICENNIKLEDLIKHRKEKINSIVKIRELYREKIKLVAAIKNIKNKLYLADADKTKIGAIKNLKVDLEGIDKQLAQLRQEKELLVVEREQLLIREENLSRVAKLDEEQLLYQIYLKFVRKRLDVNIASRLVNKISYNMNEILQKVCEFTIAFEIDGGHVRPYTFDRGVKVKAKSASGGQQFIIDLAYRLAMLRYNQNLPKFLIVDEGFGSLDEVNLKSVAGYIRKLDFSKFAEWTVLVSHIKLSEGECPRIEVIIGEKGSILQFGKERNLKSVINNKANETPYIIESPENKAARAARPEKKSARAKKASCGTNEQSSSGSMAVEEIPSVAPIAPIAQKASDTTSVAEEIQKPRPIRRDLVGEICLPGTVLPQFSRNFEEIKLEVFGPRPFPNYGRK